MGVLKNTVGQGLHDGKNKCVIKQMGTSGNGLLEGFHLSLAVRSRMDVCAFYKAALINGAKDNRPPGLRPHFGDSYYAAFIINLGEYRIVGVYKYIS